MTAALIAFYCKRTTMLTCLIDHQEHNLDWFPRMRAMSLVSSDAEGEQNEIRNLQEKLESTMRLVANLSGQLSELKEQVPTRSVFVLAAFQQNLVICARRGRVADCISDLLSSAQMTEQRKQKQRIGLLGHPPHMNINPQQPA